MLTDNPVLVRKHQPLPALMCAQRKASKKISTDDDFIKSNIDSFGNDIGQTTNWITSMFEVRSHFKEDSNEYKTLSYRIQCGQLFQQNSIDKAKGVVCKPMPKTWHDRHAVNKIEDGGTKFFHRDIVANRKPYFMKYIYPSLMKQYNTYIKDTTRNALREFGMTVDEISLLPYDEMSDRQRDFLSYYEYRLPVGIGDCVVNRICRKFESSFDGYIKFYNNTNDFDYTVLRTDTEYNQSQFYSVKKVYDEYNRRVRNYMIFAEYEKIDKTDSQSELSMLKNMFREECDKICPNEDELFNMLLDLCYCKNTTKKFVWDIFEDKIVSTLLLKNNGIISFPEIDTHGDILYCGNRFKVRQIKIGGSENDCIE